MSLCNGECGGYLFVREFAQYIFSVYLSAMMSVVYICLFGICLMYYFLSLCNARCSIRLFVWYLPNIYFLSLCNGGSGGYLVVWYLLNKHFSLSLCNGKCGRYLSVWVFSVL